MLSSDSDLDLLGRLITRAGFRARLAYERSFYIEFDDPLRATYVNSGVADLSSLDLKRCHFAPERSPMMSALGL